MSRKAPIVRVIMTVVVAALAGCQPQQPFYFKKVDDNNLAHWKGVATEIEYPDVEADRLDDVEGSKRPFSLMNNEKQEVWDLTLEEAMRLALTNNKVMRNIGGQIQGPPDFLLRNPEIIPTIYDPALAESNPRTGAEAALAAFDTQFSSTATWQRLATPMNVNNFIGSQIQGYFPDVNDVDQSTFQARLAKTAATGGQFAISHNVNYNHYRYPNALLSKEYTTDWNVNLTAEMRQPLLQGAGVQFNRIAGPGATPGLYNGVVLARITTDIALADFEAAVRNLVSDVETAYWELYFQYRSLDAVIAGRDSALSTWRKIYTLYRIGGKGGEAEKEAQAREQYYLFRSTAEQSLNGLYSAESKLRYLLGLAATDGRLIRPKDEPTTAKVVFDWYDVLNEGLARSVELREQKWIVKRRELELIAAKNFLLPKLDFVAQYKWLGLGDQIDGPNSWNSATNAGEDTNAYRTLTHGSYQEWQTGLQLNMPLGFRRELAGVRNAQLYLARERTKLQEGELELSHQLAYAIRDQEKNHVLSQTDFNRRIAAQREVEAVAAAYETDTVTLDVLLKAQQNLAQAESDYFRALVDYNKSISQVHFRKGSLLEYNGVYLAEGPWPAKAYFDANRLARSRDASTYLDYGFTQPRVMSRGPIEQHAGGGSLFEGSEMDATPGPTPANQTPTPANPELVPTPAPEPVPSEMMPTPAAPQPMAEPQASVSGGKKNGGWTTAKLSSNRTVDKQVTATGWTAAEKSGQREPAAKLSTATSDRSASGWKGAQRY